jgi:hypothetical protein
MAPNRAQTNKERSGSDYTAAVIPLRFEILDELRWTRVGVGRQLRVES